MRPASSAFQETIQSSYRLATQAVVNDTAVAVIDGTVTLDSAAAVRGRCDVTIVDDGTLDLIPDRPDSLLAPYGNEITLARGVTYPDATTELVTLGVFGIQSVEVNDTAAGLEIRVSGLDRAARFINARFEAPYQISAGTNYTEAILATLQEAWPDVPAIFEATTLITPSLIAQEGEDRWAFCQQMAEAISMTLYFNGDGICVLAPLTQTEPVATISEGDDGVLLEAARNWTREGTYNRVIATGENTGETLPVRGVATDENPFSPTYYYGPFGRVPRFYASPFLTTTEQAQGAAASILLGELGTTEQVNFGSLVLPHLEPGDVLRITRERAGINEDHILTSVTIPLTSSSAMTGQTRASRVTRPDITVPVWWQGSNSYFTSPHLHAPLGTAPASVAVTEGEDGAAYFYFDVTAYGTLTANVDPDYLHVFIYNSDNYAQVSSGSGDKSFGPQVGRYYMAVVVAAGESSGTITLVPGTAVIANV